MSRMRWTFLIALLLSSCLMLNPWQSGANRLPDQVRTLLLDSDQLELLSLDPFPPPVPSANDFHGWRVLGRTTIPDWLTRQRAVRAVLDGIAASDGKAATCFYPRHGIRASHEEHAVELVLGFECNQVQVYLDGLLQKGSLTDRSPQPVLDSILAGAGVPLTPGPSPGQP